MKKDKELTATQQEEKEDLMLKCGELQSKRFALVYGTYEFAPFIVGIVAPVLIIAINVALGLTGITQKIADFLTISKGWTITILVVLSVIVIHLIISPILRIYHKVKKTKAEKNHGNEIKNLDEQINDLVKQIVDKFGGDEKKVLKQCSKAYQSYLSKKRLAEDKEKKQRDAELAAWWRSDSSSDSSGTSTDSSSSQSTSSSSSWYVDPDNDPSVKGTYVDGWGREVAYRDGNRVYSSETHDQIGFVSGNHLYNTDGETIGVFDENGKYTKL